MLEKFLRNLMQHENTNHDKITFLPNCCILTINHHLIAKITYTITTTSNQYDAISVEIINKNKGQIDKLVVKISDIIGIKKIDKTNIRPHLWKSTICNDNDNIDWYTYEPTNTEFEKMYEIVNKYIDTFR